MREGLDKLQSALPRIRPPNINVTLPEQKFTNGLVRIKIVETNAAERNPIWPRRSPICSSRPKAENRRLKFVVIGLKATRRCPSNEFNILTNYIGDLDFARIREGLGKLQLRYRDLGFPTISVTLPQQKLTNGIVRVQSSRAI